MFDFNKRAAERQAAADAKRQQEADDLKKTTDQAAEFEEHIVSYVTNGAINVTVQRSGNIVTLAHSGSSIKVTIMSGGRFEWRRQPPRTITSDSRSSGTVNTEDEIMDKALDWLEAH